MKDFREVLLAPVVSEKSYGLLDENKYTFLVAPDANKTEIKIAVEKVFGVKVLSVNTLNREGKNKRTRLVMESAKTQSEQSFMWPLATVSTSLEAQFRNPELRTY
jgi:ribosomal protein L23